ncbi:palmitoyltransferase ZDHHC4 [Marchantia polymorpha subsp. ruderalis]|uniref:S-acyltransferase n=2 Tax=Marchantia polymorpha TaxID=3197 RepID=A0AAF6B117_MARPO|nr:hypothetical protein MARPO_0004s0142 [Marchantia polymorpha]BBN05701.1 hypothetical protein Mp_3g15300 [Marchantia polymorpha subsp. ruderalis]|eukprot:PTQ48880.1 hypothetical protein MARPO_0004s0142 [Marchantia polymorpha]
MTGQWLLIGYAGLLPFLLFVLLCGDRPSFEGTCLERTHHFIFAGGCCESLQYLIFKLFGEIGSRTCSSVEQYLCDRPNPILQLFYLSILGGSYFAIASTSLQYIPGIYVSEWHKYAGQAAVLVGLLLFLLTSFTDPGVINSTTLQKHISSFPYDGVIYGEKKDCSTCNVSRPARSKHCSICDRCVARFDHHCGWMNNCIGEKNLRYFLSFLIWHVILCWYGAVLLGAILLGEVEGRNVVRAISYYYGSPSTLREVYPHVLQWLLTFYSTQVLMMVFLLVVSILLAGFALYHIYLVVVNTTTNETYKWDAFQRWQADVAWKKILDESRKAAADRPESGEKVSRKCGLFSFLFRRHPKTPPKPAPSAFKRDNIYNRGMLANLAEVIFPLSQRNRRKKKE